MNELIKSLQELEHTKDCTVRNPQSLCSCGLSIGRQYMDFYIDNLKIQKRNEETEKIFDHAKTN